jgi:hypothetical protein
MFRQASELFLLGLLSVMDALLNVPMFDVLAQIPVDDAIKTALLGSPPAGTARFSKLSSTMNAEPGNNWLNPLAASACTRTFCQIYTFSLFGGLGKCLPSRQRLSGSGPFTSTLLQIPLLQCERRSSPLEHRNRQLNVTGLPGFLCGSLRYWPLRAGEGGVLRCGSAPPSFQW